MRCIYVLLTRSSTVPSRMIHLVTGDDYTHVSISFDGELTDMYSFARKYPRLPLPGGLVREGLRRGYLLRHGEMPCALLEAKVTDEVFERARQTVLGMVSQSWKYSYSIRGLAKCRRGIAEERPNYYFCSQFVGEILHRSGAAALPKPPSLMRPLDFAEMPEFCCLYRGTVRELREQLTPDRGCRQSLAEFAPGAANRV